MANFSKLSAGKVSEKRSGRKTKVKNCVGCQGGFMETLLPSGSSAHYGRIRVIRGSVKVCSNCVTVLACEDKRARILVDGRKYVIEAGQVLTFVTIANFAVGVSGHGILVKNGCEGHCPTLINLTGTMNNDVLYCLDCGTAYVRTQAGYKPSKKLAAQQTNHLGLELPPMSAKVPLFDQHDREYQVWTLYNSCGDHTPSSFRAFPGNRGVVCRRCNREYEVSERSPNLLVATDRRLVNSRDVVVDSIFAGE